LPIGCTGYQDRNEHPVNDERLLQYDGGYTMKKDLLGDSWGNCLRESSVYQAILAEGRAKGRAEARAEGEAEGRIAEAKKLLLLLGQIRFGPPDKSTRASLEALTDLNRLEEFSGRLLDVTNWQELLNLPKNRGKSRRWTPEELESVPQRGLYGWHTDFRQE
jgi:hypothetical protein